MRERVPRNRRLIYIAGTRGRLRNGASTVRSPDPIARASRRLLFCLDDNYFGQMSQPPGPPARQPAWARTLGFVGVAAHFVAGYFYVAAGLVAPLYGIVVLWILWVALLAVAVWLLRRHPLWILAIPFVAVGILYGGIAFGETVLGWRP